MFISIINNTVFIVHQHVLWFLASEVCSCKQHVLNIENKKSYVVHSRLIFVIVYAKICIVGRDSKFVRLICSFKLVHIEATYVEIPDMCTSFQLLTTICSCFTCTGRFFDFTDSYPYCT